MPTPKWLKRTIATILGGVALAAVVSLFKPHVDTFEDIWPDPARRESVFLGMLVNVVGAYQAVHGALPDSLLVALQSAGNISEAKRPMLLIDTWNTPVRYTPHDFVYAITSAGPDRQFGTEDDLVASGPPPREELYFGDRTDTVVK